MIGLEETLNRDLELTGDSTVEDLVFAVLSTVGADGSRRWTAEIPGRIFQYPDLEGRDASAPPDPIATTLQDLPLKPGRKVLITYDPRLNWTFAAEVTNIQDLAASADVGDYPKVTGGTGAGIQPNLNPLEMTAAVNALLEGRPLLDELPKEDEEELYIKYGDMLSPGYDYTAFDVQAANESLAGDMADILDTAYRAGERPFTGSQN